MAKNNGGKPAISIGEKIPNFDKNIKKKTDNLKKIMIEVC